MTEQTAKQKLPPITKKINATLDSNSPFNIPNDNQVFRLSKQTIEKNKGGKIWQKNTASCRNPLKRFDKFTVQIDQKYIPSHVYNGRDQKLIDDAIQLINMRKKNKDLGQKKQIIVDVLQQKKQMFLVTMTHGIIQNQITNLKTQSNQRKKALQQSQSLLIKDKKSFENYKQKYKQQTKKAQEQYQIQVQNRKVKEQLYKNKQINANSLRSQKLRNQQNVASYIKYKQFLDKLPPKQWIEEQQKIKQKKIQKIKESYIKVWFNQYLREMEEQKKIKLKQSSPSAQKLNQFTKKFNELVKNQEIQEIQELENHQQMYFKQPHQLIQYFNNLEQANLFCMQQAQRALQSFQTLKTEFYEKKASLEGKYKFLIQHKSTLQKQLSELQFLVKSMKKKKQINSSNISQKDNKDLRSIIINEYSAMKQIYPSILPDIQNNIVEPLSLLSQIEITIEKQLDKLLEASHQNPKIIKQIKNTLQKKKNIQKREEIALLNKQQEQKRKIRNLNKKEPINKTVGRIDMMRSAPRDKEISKKVQIVDNKEDQNKKYLQ